MADSDVDVQTETDAKTEEDEEAPHSYKITFEHVPKMVAI